MRRQDDYPGRRRRNRLEVIHTALMLGIGFIAGLLACGLL